MTYEEAFEILRDTPIDIRSAREDDIHTLYATAQNMALDAVKKQIPKKPNGKDGYNCGKCGTGLFNNDRYCWKCGQAIERSGANGR